MISADTNIIVRLLIKDDKNQHKKARDLFKNNEVFIPDTVILETEWVLRYAYDCKPLDIINALTNLFGLPNVHAANPSILYDAIKWHEAGLDFADAMHLSTSQHCSELYTFDKSFVTKSNGISKCDVRSP